LTDEQKLLVEKWREMGLEWTPLTWHPGRELKNKFLDIWDGLKVATKLRAKGYRYIITLGSVAGTYAYIFSKITGVSSISTNMRHHSGYGIDNWVWEKGALTR